MIPASFSRLGLVSAAQIIKPNGSRFRRLMLGLDGPTNSGKSEFANSAPGPGACLCIDRGIDGMLANPNPPTTRNIDFAYRIFQPPMPSAATQNEFVQYWALIRDNIYQTVNTPELRTCVIDGDSDSWEIQRMADFGKLTQVPPHMYTGTNAARRAFYARLWDSGKIIIATNKIKKEYETVVDDKGQPALKDGKERREWTGNYERQGFTDQEYLWQIQLSCLYAPEVKNEKGEITTNQEWGVRINMCKANRSLEGTELWGADCNFKSLVQFVYPRVPLSEWGF